VVAFASSSRVIRFSWSIIFVANLFIFVKAAYNKNLSTLFSENYGLAYTQNKKNKDIPEFGSKVSKTITCEAAGLSNFCCVLSFPHVLFSTFY